MLTQTATQFRDVNSSTICDVVVGLDFGTSCSKVVLQSPYFADRRAMLVCFGDHGHPINNHLLPTRLFYDAQGNCSLSVSANSFCATGLKLKLLLDSDSAESLSDFMVSPRTLTIAYIALVLRLAKSWFIKTQSSIYGHFSIRWHFNIGIPSPGYDDLKLKELFRSIAIDAWRFSLDDNPVSLAKIWRHLGGDFKLGQKLNIDPGDIQVLPEIIAEVLGYVKSHAREDGLHVLIDIGASTIDISGFTLGDHKGEDRYAFLTSDLAHLGAYKCHQERVRLVKEHLHRWFAHLAGRQDLILPIVSSLSEYFPKLDDFGSNAEREVLDEFYWRCRSLIHRTLKSLRQDRDPRSEKWQIGLPIFLCGGGKYLRIYRQVLDDINEFWKTSMNTQGLDIRNLPRPNDKLVAESLDEQNFDRFAVAYGLSFPYYDVGEIKPPGSIENIVIDPTSKYSHIEMVSKDMV